VRFLLLGPLEVWDEDRAVLLGGPKQRTVLAHLALRANRVVTADRLIDALWGEEPPDTARNTLQTYVRHLRRALGADRILHRSSGYVLEAGPGEVDVSDFENLVERARQVVAGDVSTSATRFREALALWRGPALDDLADQVSLQADIARLEETRLAALEQRIAAELELGRHRELVGELDSLVSRHPYREALWADLVVALYRSGRQGDALTTYRRARDVLGDELGIDPSPDLQRLQEQILRQDPALDVPGRRLRGYRLLEEVGEGAFGTVHRAFQPEVGREVAVKVIGRRLADRPEFIRRFDVEAQLIARLEHPHIVPLYDYWREPDGAYLVMRYLRGGNLRDALRTGPLAADTTLSVIDQIALALASAHRQGVVHRDVKPENVLFDEEGNAYLSDFGIAKDLTTSEAGFSAGVSSTPAPYRSPEERRGEPLTTLTDVYGLGCLLFECLSGRRPSPDRRSEGGADAGRLSVIGVRPDLPRSVDDVLARATAVEPTDRFPDVTALTSALHEALEAPDVEPPVEGLSIRNPYKGLQAFQEADVGDFFGREHAVGELVERMVESASGGRFLAVVGPSGSGKSSLVRAGLVPALRGGAIRGSDRWFIVDLIPGPHPFDELAAALTRIAVDPRPDLADRLRDEDGLVRVAEELVPDGAELVVVIDQFEEVFSLVAAEEDRRRFLAAIAAAAAHPRSRVRIVVTLRADFYDRPLEYPGFGDLLARRTNAVAPMSLDELERAVVGPADAVGVTIEPALLTEMVAEVAGRPGALPLLQYALTEVFEGRTGSTLTVEAYRSVGGVSGAIARRAEAIYARLGPDAQEAVRQLFLRLVAVGDGPSEVTRRRVHVKDLLSLADDRASMEEATDAFGARRLLSFDRDPATRGPTVELAHEALLREWRRFRDWVDTDLDELRRHQKLSAWTDEWVEAGRSEDYLLAGDRLVQMEAVGSDTVRLTEDERAYLAAGRTRATAAAAAEGERQAREARLERRSVTRLRALVAVLAAASLVAATLTIVVTTRSRAAEREGRRNVAGRLTAGSIASLGSDPQLSLALVLAAIHEMADLGEPVPARTVEALHWALQEAGVDYPVRSGPVKVVAGPSQRRGVFDLPIGQLTQLAEANVTRTLTPAECQQYFGTPSCPDLSGSLPSDLPADPVEGVAPVDPAKPLAGTQVTVYMEFDPEANEAVDFQEQMRPFTERTGIDVRIVGVPDFLDWLGRGVPGSDPPDVAFFVQPAGLARLAQQGYLSDLSNYLDVDQLREDTSPYLMSLGTLGADGSWPSSDGSTYGIFARLSLKSLVWYPVPEFQQAGYSIPRTWDGLVALSKQMVADGRTPWCLGWESADATGWPGTDWIENLLLAAAGPDVYDRWTNHQLPFDSPEVRAAFNRLGDILFPDGSVLGGSQMASQQWFGGAQVPMVAKDPPRCWLHQFPSFEINYLPPGAWPDQTNVFPFPSIQNRDAQGLIGGGEMIGAFADRPEVREVVRYMVSPEFGVGELQLDEGFIIANRRFSLENYSPFWRRQAELAYQTLATDTFRFDASDLMPPPVGQDLFWKAMMTYAAEGPGSLDGILKELDAAWPSDSP
jgi:serine/threonine protein kinase/ABC-type glycerol-3-phosphate transport system substrate-binding protein